MSSVIAIDLGGTKIAGALLTREGTVRERHTRPVGSGGGVEVADTIVELIGVLRSASSESQSTVGICVPGISHTDTGRVWAPNIPGWEDFPLEQHVRAVFPAKDVLLRIDSDRACSILGELWHGAAQGCRNAIFLAVGTGIGAGILADGKVLRGAHDIAGAIGWLGLSQPFRTDYTPCGDFEFHASGHGLARVARERIAATPGYNGPLRGKDPAALTAYDVFAAFESHDPIAEKVLSLAVVYWGMAAANLVSLFNPEKIIFGGGIFGPASRFLEDIRREAERWAQPISMKKVKFDISALGSDAALYGAGFLALQAGTNTGTPFKSTP